MSSFRGLSQDLPHQNFATTNLKMLFLQSEEGKTPLTDDKGYGRRETVWDQDRRISDGVKQRLDSLTDKMETLDLKKIVAGKYLGDFS